MLDQTAFVPLAPMLARAFRPPLATRTPRTSISKSQARCGISASSTSPDIATSGRIPEPTKLKPVRLYNTNGLIPYNAAWRWQHELVDELKRNKNAADALILLEHQPVYTLGTRSDVSNVLFDAEPALAGSQGAELVRTERGGEVTYHGPGQLVAYPVLNLGRAPHRRDLHWYARGLENCLIDTLACYGVTAARRDGAAGVWVGDAKIAALGLKVSKWITMHGVAMNVDADLAPFRRIVPCGLKNAGVTSLNAILGVDAPSMADVKQRFVEVFKKRFAVSVRNTFDTRFMRVDAAKEREEKARIEQSATV